MERKRIGYGWEHNVYEGKRNKGMVIKTPTRKQRIILNVLGMGINDIRHEIEEKEKLLSPTGIKSPRTRVLPTIDGKSYVIGQKRIINDRTEDISARMTEQRSEHLQTLQQIRPSNFLYQNGSIYMVDLTKGPVLRVFERFGVSEEKYKKLILTVKNFLRL